jgi:hypothetical protein
VQFAEGGIRPSLSHSSDRLSPSIVEYAKKKEEVGLIMTAAMREDEASSCSAGGPFYKYPNRLNRSTKHQEVT